MADYTKLVQSIAKNWIRVTTPTVKPHTEIAKEIIASFNKGLHASSATVGDTLDLTLKTAKKYVDEFCDVITEGKYTVVKHKTGGLVDISQIGELNKDGTIIRYKTAKQAEEEAKKILMRQFDFPAHQQQELCLVTRDKDLFLNSVGQYHFATLPDVIEDKSIPKRELKVFHNHPTNNPTSKSYPLSIGDIYMLTRNEVNSITAFNHLGEYNTATITTPFISNPDSVSQWLRNELIKKLEPLFGKKVIPEKNPELYIREIHKAYKELLSKSGIEYSTNYSYLKNV